ncbi:MAG: ABC transporter substrate-binding protein, partial [Anaerolineaceae bacterium]|nr:ABC transporter substrate-binding protein [Anaerolineaceae bacterium]
IDYLLRMAGGENVAGSLSGEWVQMSQEEIILQDPDLILLGDFAYGVTPEQVAARPGWEALKAVTQKQVYPFDDDLVSRPGPRLVDGLVALARILHPDQAGSLE